jgi:hypothetical protein
MYIEGPRPNRTFTIENTQRGYSFREGRQIGFAKGKHRFRDGERFRFSGGKEEMVSQRAELQ